MLGVFKNQDKNPLKYNRCRIYVKNMINIVSNSKGRYKIFLFLFFVEELWIKIKKKSIDIKTTHYIA